ncbi:MAG: DUF3536 domain-containing protein [Candidatus Omnitrophota bacterium]
MNRYLCVHGHFYQPPRENPWLEEVEIQDSAYPYHDWNERITIECYAPNSASRILDRENKIIDIVNNYQKISFNFGPTLLSWLQRKKPQIYQAIINADRISQKNFSGHGSAIAQVYNHMIMPLANTNDRYTQIAWGIKDFEYRFGRFPEGMWLAETAVDLQTLDIMAEFGIKFTILSPYQAQKIKKIEEKDWLDVSSGKIDPKMPYLCKLDSGRAINIFFYDGPVSQDIAFGGLLSNGENLVGRLVGIFSDTDNPQLVHIAADGETYGHHHNYGEMALSYGFYHIDKFKKAQITIYGEYLEKFPPKYEVKIIENSSWSCFHGVERWQNDCGCNVRTNANWNQSWRKYLRKAMDWLNEKLVPVYIEQISKYTEDPWKLRNNYISVILNRSQDNVNKFLQENINKTLSETEKTNVLKLLEMQRHAMLMYTSCGWFFDEVSGIETVQVINYAARAIQLAKQVTGTDLEPDYLKLLKKAKSNIEEYADAANLYQRFVKSTVLDLKRVGAHYAISSLFNEYEPKTNIYCYEVISEICERMEVGKQQLIIGNIKIKSNIVYEEDKFSYAVLSLGDHVLFGGVCDILKNEEFAQMHKEVKLAFNKSDVSAVVSLFDKYFKSHDYRLWHLFRDEQRKILDKILDSTLLEIELSFRQINEHHYPIMLAMKEIGMPLPSIFANTFEFIINKDLKSELNNEEIDINRLQDLVKEAKLWSLKIDKTTLGFLASEKIRLLMERFNTNPQNIDLAKKIKNIFIILNPLSLQLRIWETQNVYFSIKKELFEMMRTKADQKDVTAKKWVENFNALGEYLSIKSK